MRLPVFVALSLVAGTAAAAQESPFLFDALQNRVYHGAWEKLMKTVQPTPDWLLQFNKNFDGVASELKPVTIDGKTYQIAYVCKPSGKPGECAERKFEVLFETGGTHAYGALGGRNEDPAYFGAPSPAMQDVLAKAVKD
ncbi:MAG TPA: Ivy family c-type lysozyme inhibitor [Roseiarcus sp.]